MIINRLPEIGEDITTAFNDRRLRATVISMADCKRRAPTLFGRDLAPQAETYGPDDCIRAWLDEEGKANFCIMRFGTAEKGFVYNEHIHAPEETKPMTTTQPTDKDCAEMTTVVEAADTVEIKPRGIEFHQRPNGTGECPYMAGSSGFCNKCGWFDPAKRAAPAAKPSPTPEDCAEMTTVVEATDTAHGDWGEIVAAITGDAGVRAAAMNRASVRAAVQVRISCQCGSILDTRSAMLVEDAGEKAIAIVCGNCVGKYRKILQDSAARVGKKGALPPGVVVAYLRFGSGKCEEIKTP